MTKLNGKITLITGGSTGIGLATAKRFVAEGAYVFITGRRQAELDQAAREIGRNVTAVQGDIANLADLDRLYATIKQEKGAIDIVVANAAIVEMRTLPEVTPEHFDKVFGINVRGTLFTVQKALPLLRDRGSIVIVSSVADRIGIPSYSVYSATKGATRSFARTWAAELKTRGIRVNTVSPGPIDTPIFETQGISKAETTAMKEGFAAMVPLGRIGRSEEIASAILFFASDESSFTTGSDFVADGGLTEI